MYLSSRVTIWKASSPFKMQGFPHSFEHSCTVLGGLRNKTHLNRAWKEDPFFCFVWYPKMYCLWKWRFYLAVLAKCEEQFTTELSLWLRVSQQTKLSAASWCCYYSGWWSNVPVPSWAYILFLCLDEERANLGRVWKLAISMGHEQASWKCESEITRTERGMANLNCKGQNPNNQSRGQNRTWFPLACANLLVNSTWAASTH